MWPAKVNVTNLLVDEKRRRSLKGLLYQVQIGGKKYDRSLFFCLFCQAPTRVCMRFALLLCSFARLGSDFSALTFSPLTPTSTASFPSFLSKHVIVVLSRLFAELPEVHLLKNAELLRLWMSQRLDEGTGRSTFPEQHLQKSSGLRSQVNYPRKQQDLLLG